MSTPTVDLGVAQKDLTNGYDCCVPCCPSGDDPAKKKEWEETIVYPEFDVDGKQAELMGADDLQVDDVVEVTLKLKVKAKRDNTKKVGEEVKRDMCITFCILETSDLTDQGTDDEGAGEKSKDKNEGMEMEGDGAPVKELLSAGKSKGSGMGMAGEDY